MGISSGKPSDAGHRAVPGRRADPRTAAAAGGWRRVAAGLIALACVLGAQATLAETLRVATFAAPFSADGPGLLLRDLAAGDPQFRAALDDIAAAAPDILLLTDVDYDADGLALQAIAGALAERGLDLPYRVAFLPNAGMASGLDLDGDGRLGMPRDAQGYGRFAGQGGLGILSRWPPGGGARDLSDLLWRDLPGAVLPVMDGAAFPSDAAQAAQRLSSTGHWIVPVAAPGGIVTLLAFGATTPVFDGPEDMNGLRNRDELRLWTLVMDGRFGPPPEGHFVILGNANLDPVDGQGYPDAMAAFLADPRIIDPRPASPGAAALADPRQRGDPATDTADWGEDGAGNLRVSYVLPSADWIVADAGVLWPAGTADPAPAGPHHLVWVDLRR